MVLNKEETRRKEIQLGVKIGYIKRKRDFLMIKKIVPLIRTLIKGIKKKIDSLLH